MSDLEYNRKKMELLYWKNWIDDDYIANLANKYMSPETEELYKRALSDPDIIDVYKDRVDIIRRKIIWSNNINMSNIEQADPVQGIKPSLAPDYSLKTPIKYDASQSPFAVRGLGNESTLFTLNNQSYNYPELGLLLAIAGTITFVIYGYGKKKKSK